MTGWLTVMLAVALGGWCGWQLGSIGGLMGSYFSAVVGSSVGLYLGRRIQRALDGD